VLYNNVIFIKPIELVLLMRPPCEIVVNTILPNVRAELVKVLIEDYGLRQVDVATLLDITQASVSQYRTLIRGRDELLLEIFPEIEKYTKEAARCIMEDNKDTENAEPWNCICEMCKKILYNPKFNQYRLTSAQMSKCGVCKKE